MEIKMSKGYDYAQIEKKWQGIWDEKQTFAAKDDYSLVTALHLQD